jgi:xylulokinase
MAIDQSYASGSGAYSLKDGMFAWQFLDAAGLSASIFPHIVPSHTIVGRVTSEAAAACGLSAGTPVACGGVDNACMALGAVGPDEGKVYLSLGSSSWIPVNSQTPILDYAKKPYVFAHIAEGMFTSAFSIFSGGSSLKWARDNIFSGAGGFEELDHIADGISAGSGGIYFNPSLAGGTSQDKSPNIRGAYIGLHLGTTREEMLRAAMEGITLNLKLSYDFLRESVHAGDSLLICGGGSKSSVWLQMFADVFGVEIIKTNIDQDAASLGAVAIAARGAGLWTDYRGIAGLHNVEARYLPRPEYAKIYAEMLPKFAHISETLADLGDALL